MIAFVQFAVPALLVGIAAAALPLLIHLLLRPRPRHIAFPAVAYLRAAFASGQRAQRLRNLWLMLTRALLLACIAVLLAGPTCTPEGVLPTSDEPIACVLVIDDAWSMRYEADPGRTLVDRAIETALAICGEAERWPATSVLGLVWADATRSPLEPTDDLNAVRIALRAYRARKVHADTLGQAVERAASLLQTARQPRRRLVVLTDLCAHAWRDTAPGMLAGIEALSVDIRNLAPTARSNIAIVAAEGPRGLHPENAPVSIRVTARADGLPATCYLIAREADRIVERIGPISIPADRVYETTLVLPARVAGIHALALAIEPGDRLPYDQRRYVGFQTGPKPVAWLVVPHHEPADTDIATLILRNLLAPDTLAAARQLADFRQIDAAELVALDDSSSAGRRRADLIVVTGGIDLNEAARGVVREQVEDGATLLLIPSDRPAGADWPGLRRMLTRFSGTVEPLDGIASLAWADDSPYAQREVGLDELTRTAVRKRVALRGLEDAVVVEARYTDDAPAIVSLRQGRGRIVLLTSSPNPEWSDLGIRAAGLLTWVHVLMRDALGPVSRVASFRAGEQTRQTFSGMPDRNAVSITRQSQPRETESVGLEDGVPVAGWPTAEPGIYMIAAPGDVTPTALFVVNPVDEESTLMPIAPDRLRSLLGAPQLTIEDPTTAAGAGTAWYDGIRWIRDPARLLPLLLLVVILLEWLLSIRAHGGQVAFRER